jgi:hypothetical protein
VSKRAAPLTLVVLSLLAAPAAAGTGTSSSSAAPAPGGSTTTSTAVSAPPAAPNRETRCADRIDDDGDGLIDCGDADCFGHSACASSGGLESSDLLCSDWIDNDGDGYTDCEDVDCQRLGLTACKGSWQGPLEGTGVEAVDDGDIGGDRPTPTNPSERLPGLDEGVSVEELIGKGDDIDGERNNFVCSDGIDNDGDGKTDCADFGCRFDPAVSVCRGTPGLRFSVVASVSTSYEVNEDAWDTQFERVQLRAFGPLPFIQDSFFLLSMRAERTPRLTFAMFSMPIGGGHFVNINSGGGGLSNALILSTAKNVLLDPPFYVYSAFEQGNGAALEFNGPILPGKLEYRAFVAGGSGRFNGNVGGRFFAPGEENFTWSSGGQLGYFLTGRFDRWDTRFLYTPVPLGVSFYLGGRYDQRNQERFPAVNLSAMYRQDKLLVTGETYVKRELEFGNWQLSWNLTAAYLAIPKWLLLAADAGQYFATEFDDPPARLGTDLRRQNDEWQVRAAAHLYVWRANGLLSALYTHRFREGLLPGEADLKTDEVRIEAQFRW